MVEELKVVRVVGPTMTTLYDEHQLKPPDER